MTDTPTTPPDDPMSAAAIEAACRIMHDAYEAAAVTAGWETQARSRKPWEDVPPANQATMRAAVAALIGHLPYVEPCACPTGPNADGPVEDCPRHGRPYTYWVARADDLDHQLDALREQVHRTADRTVRDDELASRIADAATFGRCGNVNDGVGAVCMRERDHFPLGVSRTLNPHRGNGWTWT